MHVINTKFHFWHQQLKWDDCNASLTWQVWIVNTFLTYFKILRNDIRRKGGNNVKEFLHYRLGTCTVLNGLITTKGFKEKHEFPRAQLSETFTLLGTDYIQGQIFKHNLFSSQIEAFAYISLVILLFEDGLPTFFFFLTQLCYIPGRKRHCVFPHNGSFWRSNTYCLWCLMFIRRFMTKANISPTLWGAKC